MSLIFIDGFDHYNSIREKWQAAGGFDQPTFEAGRFGGQALKKQFQNAQQSIRRSFAQEGEVFFGCALKTPAFGGSAESYFRLENVAGAALFDIRITTSGNLQLVAGGTSDTSTFALDNIQWNYVEAHWIPKDAAGKGGVAEVKVNGNVVASIDGTLFATTTGADDDIGGMGIMDDGTNSPRYLMDDLYILNGSGSENNGYLGDVRITTLAASDDGNRNEWSPLTDGASNFTEVDEVVMDKQLSFVESGLVGAAEDYDNESFSSRAIAPGQIFGVQTSNATLRTASADITFKNEMVVAGVRFSDDVEYTPGNSAYFINTYVEDTDPSDSATWTEAKVAAVNSGLIITSKVTI